MTDPQFQRWFRVNRDTFEQLSEVLMMDEDIFVHGRHPMDFKKRLAMTLTFLGTTLPSYQ